MLDFEVKRCSRKCAIADRDLAPGEHYYSVLEAEGADVLRRDYCLAEWTGPPEKAIGWWKSQMPDEGAGKAKLAPSEVALELFDRWNDSPDMHDAAFVLALFLVRKRVFRFAEAGFEENPETMLRLHCPSRAADYEVAAVEVDAGRADEIQSQLVELLYADAA